MGSQSTQDNPLFDLHLPRQTPTSKMQLLYAVTALAGLVAVTSASPSSRSKRNYKFQVQNWEAGCARAGCYYNFNVSLSFTTNAETPVTYNYTGHYNATFNQFVAPTYDFKVKPDEVTAVA